MLGELVGGAGCVGGQEKRVDATERSGGLDNFVENRR